MYLIWVNMNILHIFKEHKAYIIKEWVEAVFNSYPLDTTGFLRTKQDEFCNPVGEMTTTLANFFFDAAAGEQVNDEELEQALMRFVRLRAVQNFPPSQGVGVLYVFKQMFREKILPICKKYAQIDAYLEAESRIDTLALMALDIYVDSRDTLAEQRIKEIRNQHSQVVRWAQRNKVIDSKDL